eukprot:TRINITY_DN1117_c0_g1_i1.p1 TRINITY_DN1117_c0_g1~~TRINITY_DN1117_c0_g1_i1.p1  ORF type:complete len:369 (-),score=87.04 TRINITY_DN1117_c0_g1_i1:65-1171(-)
MSGKPRVLVLGGLGFIGRHLVKYLVENDLTSKIRVADKTMIAMIRLGKEFTDAFDKVEVMQVNLMSPEGAAKAFTDPEGDYPIVINLAAETKLSQQENVYAEGITKLTTTVSSEATKHGVQKYICVSSAEVYGSSSKPCDESAPQKPWTGIGKAKLASEQNIKENKNIPAIVVRPCNVYGPGDTKFVSFLICVASVLKKKGEKLEIPGWWEEIKMNTVHVNDVVKALWHLAANAKPGDVYNLADKNDTDHKKVYKILEKVLPGFKYDTTGFIQGEATKLLGAEGLADVVKDMVMTTWVKMTTENKLEFTPLSPFPYVEYLELKPLCIDGSAIEKTGFKYEHPTVGEAELREQVNDAVAQGWLPASMLA